jgi:hypothetical protein
LYFQGFWPNLCDIKNTRGFGFMDLPEEKTALQNSFADWLAGTDGGAFECKADGYHFTVIRVRKNEDFDYLYCQRQYHRAGIERGDGFDYAGIYCLRDGLV